MGKKIGSAQGNKSDFSNQITDQKKSIQPLQTVCFPPRHLARKQLTPFLKKAHAALSDYNAILPSLQSIPSLFSSFFFLESFESLKFHTHLFCVEEALYTLLTKKSDARLLAILKYQKLLLQACKLKQTSHLTKKWICTLHQNIHHFKSKAGYRKKQNWIGYQGCTIENSKYIPPSAKVVTKMMKQLLDYSNSSQNDPLLLAALLFAQFMIIHPFKDGNGRITRIMVPLYLFQKELVKAPLLFLGYYINKHRLEYFDYLFNITEEKKWEEWIIFFLKVIISSAKKHKSMACKITALGKRFPQIPQATLDYLFQNPFFKKAAFLKKSRSSELFSELEEKGWIVKKEADIWCFFPLLELLTEH